MKWLFVYAALIIQLTWLFNWSTNIHITLAVLFMFFALDRHNNPRPAAIWCVGMLLVTQHFYFLGLMPLLIKKQRWRFFLWGAFLIWASLKQPGWFSVLSTGDSMGLNYLVKDSFQSFLQNNWIIFFLLPIFLIGSIWWQESYVAYMLPLFLVLAIFTENQTVIATALFMAIWRGGLHLLIVAAFAVVWFFSLPLWIILIAFVFIQIVSWYSVDKSLANFGSISSIDIAIPYHNEEQRLPGLLNSIDQAKKRLVEELPELNVNLYASSFGSSDNSTKLLETAGVKVRESEFPGRGNQLARCLRLGRGDIFLMLHADAIIEEDSLLMLVEYLNKNDSLGWGALGNKFDSDKTIFNKIMKSNELRFKFLSMGFGDQGLFIRRPLIKAIEGIPDYPLMEDVELSMLLQPYTSRKLFDRLLTVSTRRWEKVSWCSYQIQMIHYVWKFAWLRWQGKDMKKVTQNMFNEYYS
ncbi:MAG: glycosyltransferase [Lentisphaeria bacterium]|nr:glycosyltransferase [Lentisphaeria bacterium]